MPIGITVLIIVSLLILWVIGVYNRLVSLRNQVKNSWSQIDVQLQRRYDLIPNLVETVKSYMGYEMGTLEAVVRARNQAVKAREVLAKNGGPTEGSLQVLLGAEEGLKSALGNIFALAENYPQLRASENMSHLQEALSSTENKIAFARQGYNDRVLVYNTMQQHFPAGLLSSLFGHHSIEPYGVEDAAARKAVKVSF